MPETEITLRPATADDRNTIRRMIISAMLDPTTLDWRNFVLAVDTAANRVVGCAQIKPYPDCREFGSLYVLPAYRRLGVGGQLLRALVDAAARPMYLMCLNKMAGYYTGFGFAEVEAGEMPPTLRRKHRLGRLLGVNVICMRRD
jgi:amino-acid N-acetyltransferase